MPEIMPHISFGSIKPSKLVIIEYKLGFKLDTVLGQLER